jgi:hypothetical protein
LPDGREVVCQPGNSIVTHAFLEIISLKWAQRRVEGLPMSGVDSEEG